MQNIASLIKDTDICFKIFKKISKIDITGGEPLLYAPLTDYLKYFLEVGECYDRVRIVTNGTVLPPTSLLDVCEKFNGKFEFMIDKYPLSNKVEQICDICKHRKITFLVRNYSEADVYMGGWVDYGDFSEKQDDMKECFNIIQVSNLYDGKIIPCCIQIRALQLGGEACHIACQDMVGLDGDIEDIKRNVVQILKNRPQLCRYCKAKNDSSARVKPAEQLKLSF